MRSIRSAPVFALLVAACQSNARTPPAADESPSVSASTSTAVDTGTSGPAGSAAPITSPDDGQQVTALARLPGPQPADSQEALLEGTLVAQAGCLWVVSPEGSRYAVLWPPHVELAPGVRPARITDRQSGASAQVGGRIRVGGGEVPGTPALGGSVPGGCQGPFWLATGIVAPAG
jgi:hypothetical protein